MELAERIREGFIVKLDESKLVDCMRCGFCLPSCPTYLHSNYDEVHSPRGRIAMMKAVRDGVIPFDESVEESLNLCLGCRACEMACPAGVEYGDLIENARVVIHQEKPQTSKEKFLRKTTLGGIFKDPEKMQRTVNLVRFYQKSGLQKVARNTKLLSWFPKALQEMEGVLPTIERYESLRGRVYHPNLKTARVAFFTGCLMETMFAKTNRATVKLLQLLGCEVVIPDEQYCCGALHGHSGDIENAKANARKNIDSFLNDDVDYIINNAGGCGAFLEEYNHLFKDDPIYQEKSDIFSEKVIDITSLLYYLGITRFNLSVKSILAVTYQDSCHLRNVSGVINEPREILKSIENVEYMELNGADHCCGSAGIYNLIHNDMSMKILDDKMEKVKEINPHIIITTNPGCLLQMKLGIERFGLNGQIEAMHLVDFIDKYALIDT